MYSTVYARGVVVRSKPLPDEKMRSRAMCSSLFHVCTALVAWEANHSIGENAAEGDVACQCLLRRLGGGGASCYYWSIPQRTRWCCDSWILLQTTASSHFHNFLQVFSKLVSGFTGSLMAPLHVYSGSHHSSRPKDTPQRCRLSTRHRSSDVHAGGQKDESCFATEEWKLSGRRLSLWRCGSEYGNPKTRFFTIYWRKNL